MAGCKSAEVDELNPQIEEKLEEESVEDEEKEVSTVKEEEESKEEEIVERDIQDEKHCHITLADWETRASYLYQHPIQIPWELEYSPDGYIYIADWTGRRILRMDKDGNIEDIGIMEKNPDIWQELGPWDIALDSLGNLYFCGGAPVGSVNKDLSIEVLIESSEQAPEGRNPRSITFNSTDELYYADMINEGKVFKLGPDGERTIIADLEWYGDIVFGLDGTIYVSQWNEGNVVKINPQTGEVSEFVSNLMKYEPIFLTVDSDGDIWVRDAFFGLHQFSPTGEEKQFWVDGELGSERYWHTSGGITFDDEGSLYVASFSSAILKLTPTSSGKDDYISSAIVPGFEVTDLEVGPNNEVYAWVSSTAELIRFEPDGNSEVLLNFEEAGGFQFMKVEVAVNKDGTVFISSGKGEIEILNTDGSLSHYLSINAKNLICGFDNDLYAVTSEDNPKIIRISDVDTYEVLVDKMDYDNHVQIAPSPDGGIYYHNKTTGELYHIASDGEMSLYTSLEVRGICPIAVSPNGEIFVGPHPSRFVYRIDPDGETYLHAIGIMGDPYAMAVSTDGEWLYVAESGAIDKIPIGLKAKEISTPVEQ